MGPWIVQSASGYPKTLGLRRLYCTFLSTGEVIANEELFKIGEVQSSSENDIKDHLQYENTAIR